MQPHSTIPLGLCQCGCGQSPKQRTSRFCHNHHRIGTGTDPIWRFWQYVDREGPVPKNRPDLGPCWLWTKGQSPDGYGRFAAIRDHLWLTHRISYTLLIGPIPHGLTLDHLCRVRHCCNPQHLEPVPSLVNVRRGRRWESEKTHCPQGHPYDEGNTYASIDRYGHYKRNCRQCAAKSQRAWREKHRL